MTQSTSTIAAIATPPGDGGVAIIRLSGPQAFEMAQALFSKCVNSLESHKLYYGKILDSAQKVVDQGMLVVMKGPHSYTGEDTVEIHCHGGHFLSKKILKLCLDQGAEIAQPGEFTQRAFLNGKMDLAQAEAVQSLIHAKNDYALQSATQQLEGRLSQKIKQFQDHLIETAAILEAWVDFPEEGIEFASLEEITSQLEQVHVQMGTLIHSYDQGRVLHEGFTICLAGKPNVGKSSLMNALLKQDRALVTPIAGTTRDTLEESLLIDGIHYRLIDTAGIRQTEEVVEKLGIERAARLIDQADLILLILDASSPLNQEDQALIEKYQNRRVLLVWNKSDLEPQKQPQLPFSEQVKVSAQKGENVDLLYQNIPKLLMDTMSFNDEIYLSHLRHKQALEEASGCLHKVIEDLKEGQSPEWMTFDLKSALKALSKLRGFDVTESLLSHIFSTFCIGK